MHPDFEKLTALIAEIADLSRISSLLHWDLQTYMPSNGSEARSHQISTISRLVHSRVTSEEMGSLLENIRPSIEQLDPDSDEVRSFLKMEAIYQKVVRIPGEWAGEFARLTTRANRFWAQAKQENKFETFSPYLEDIVDLRRAYAEFFTPYDHIYDPLLDDYEPGMKTAEVQEVFNRLRPFQVELVRKIADCPQVDDSFLRQNYAKDKQWDFGMELIDRLGFDKSNGRQDSSPHPFTTKIGAGDVRI
ncbi:MAG: carboxypeptidase M32, partial [Anaerolineales bacterium]|nr:carboxypeptidase M32 [Anaerolineales bacterium]